MTGRPWVVAGPNGAGKSTLVARYLKGRFPIVNPDELAFGENGIGILGAGRRALEERRSRLEQGQSFAIETTLTGRGEIEFMRRAKTAGFRIALVYVGLSSADLSHARVGFRVSLGGHHVPLDDVMRRYDRSTGNLPEAVAMADRVMLIDNSGLKRRMLKVLVNGEVRFQADHLSDWANF